MRRFVLMSAALCVLPVSAWSESAPPAPPKDAAAAALPPLPTSEDGVEEQLKTFDPAAVAAARHYYQSPVMKAAMLSRLKGTIAAMKSEFADVIRKQQGLSDADRAKFDAENAKMLATIDKTATDNYDYELGLHMIIALQIFSKDELIALDNFFSSPLGQGVVVKMPLLNKRLPQVMHAIVPKMVSAIKANGVDMP